MGELCGFALLCTRSLASKTGGCRATGQPAFFSRFCRPMQLWGGEGSLRAGVPHHQRRPAISSGLLPLWVSRPTVSASESIFTSTEKGSLDILRCSWDLGWAVRFEGMVGCSHQLVHSLDRRTF